MPQAKPSTQFRTGGHASHFGRGYPSSTQLKGRPKYIHHVQTNNVLLAFTGMIKGIAFESISQMEVSPPSGISIVASSLTANSISCGLFATMDHNIIIAISAEAAFGFPFKEFAFTLSNLRRRISPERQMKDVLPLFPPDSMILRLPLSLSVLL
jgi:hypothetical protein